MATWDELHKKGYIAPPRQRTAFPRKKPLPPHQKPAPPDNKPAPEKAYQPGIWAHGIAVSMGFTDMPPAVEQEFAKLFTDPSDPDHIKALAYLRGTDWHHQKYAGFAAGAQNGIFGSEADYNAWKSQVNDSYRQFYGRAPTAAELTSFAQQGFAANTVHQIGEGHAWAQASQGDVQYALGAFDAGRTNQTGLEALGQQYAGRGSALGAGLQSKFELAMKKMERVFSGTLASPSLNLGSGGLSAPSLNPKQNPDIGR